MSLDCEICGSMPATLKASVDSVVLNVCEACSSSGKVIEPPKPKSQPPVLQYIAPESSETVASDFGKIISKARQQAGLKQDELANKLNEKLSVIHAAEQGKRLELALARKLEKFLKIGLIERG